MEQKDNLLDVLKTLLKWRKQLIIVCGLAAVGSVIVSLTLPNYFRADTVFLAISPDQSMPELVFSSSPMRSQYYGNENDIDRLLTIAESNELIQFMVDSFGLYEHYDIDPDHPKAKHLVRRAFLDLYKISKTKRDAIQLSIEDKDPEKAMHMANSARIKVNDITRKLIKSNLQKSILTYDESIKSQQQKQKFISDTLRYLRRRYGIYNTQTQTEFLSNQLLQKEAQLAQQQGRLRTLKGTAPKDTIMYLRAMTDGLRQSIDTLQSRIHKMNEGLPLVSSYEKMYLDGNQVLSDNMERYKKWKDTYESDIPATILVEEATLPPVKSRPRRSIIVLASIAIAFLFSTMAILLMDTYKDIQWKELISKSEVGSGKSE